MPSPSNPSSVADFVGATFSHKGRRKKDRIGYPNPYSFTALSTRIFFRVAASGAQTAS